MSLNTWLVKNLQYVLSSFELLFFCRSLGFYCGLTLLFFLSNQPLAAFITRLGTWLYKHIRCEGPAVLSSPSSVTKKRPDVVI